MSKGKWILLMLSVLVILCPVGLYLAWDISSRRELEQAYAELKASGRPMTLEEILPPKVPDADNGMLDVLDLCKVFASSDSYERYHSVVITLSPEQYKADPAPFNAILQDEQLIAFMKDMAAACRKPYMQMPNNHSDFVGYYFSIGCHNELTDLISPWRFLSSIVLIQALSGETKEAWQTLWLCSMLLEPSRGSISFKDQWWRPFMLRVIAKKIQQLSALAATDAEMIQRFIDVLLPEEELGPYLRSCDYERVLVCQDFNALLRVLWLEQDICPDFMEQKKMRFKFYVPPVKRVELAYLINTENKWYQFASRPICPADEPTRRALYDRVSVFSVNTLGLSDQRQKVSFYSGIAQARVTRCGLEILKYKNARGAYPQTLGELGMGAWVDPMSQNELIYSPRSDGFLLYSIGRNFVDDGGLDDPKNQDKNDIVWDYTERPRAIP